MEIQGSFTTEENIGKSHLSLGGSGEMDLEITFFMPRKAPNILTWWQQHAPRRLAVSCTCQRYKPEHYRGKHHYRL